MKYPFISCLPIIAEVLGDLKIIAQTSSFSEEDCYVWAVDCIRQIGGESYDLDSATLDVSKHCAMLPKNFYKLDEIALIGFKHPTFRSNSLCASTILAPADSATISHCNKDKICSKASKGMESYTIKIPPGIARFSFHSGEVGIKYLCLKQDTDGTIMMQDEINGILAVKNYIKTMMLQEKWILREITDNVYQTFKNDYDWYLNKAQVRMKFPDPADSKFRKQVQNHRFERFNYKRQ